MGIKRAVHGFVSVMALICIFGMLPTKATDPVPTGCDSDCVVSCFSNAKIWENKCLSLCGCQGNCPSLDGKIDTSKKPEMPEAQQLNETDEDPIEVAPDCDKACFTNCAISLYNTDQNSDYSECWTGCKCSVKSIGLNSSEFNRKIEESGISLGLIAGIFWIVIIVIGVILWCKCYSRQTRLSSYVGARTDVYYLMKEQGNQEEDHRERLRQQPRNQRREEPRNQRREQSQRQGQPQRREQPSQSQDMIGEGLPDIADRQFSISQNFAFQSCRRDTQPRAKPSINDI